MATNRRLVPLEGADFYPTPEWGTEALLREITFERHHTFWEPCCGDGSMAEVIKKRYKHNEFHASDLYDRGYGVQQDVFEQTKTYNNIITNPPFNIATEVFEHCYPLATSYLCLLLRTAFLESKDRYERIFSKMAPTNVLVFSERLSMYPKGQEKETGGTTSYSWFVWNKNVAWPAHMITPQITWISPGLKPNSRKRKNGSV